jgi:tRNA nucleotidyltransferase (CCA-adding enzyme)
MSSQGANIDLDRLPGLLGALPGVERVRAVAGDTPIYLVGGAVRDLLLGRTRADLDFAVEGDAAALGRRLEGDVRAHERFATATVEVDGVQLDLATARSETYPHPGALPEVRPASLSDDLARRDFTVNAMAVPLLGEPELIDPHGGRADLERGLLRVLHDRSFADDPTRARRAARYAARYGFELEPRTADLLRDADLATVSGERAEAELRKLAREPQARHGFELLRDWGLVDLGGDAPLLIGAVSELLDTEPWASFADREEAVLAVALGRDADAARALAAAAPERASEAVQLARGADPVTLAVARVSGAEWLDRYLADWRDVRLEIDGDDLMAAGIPEGPAVGRGLAAAMRARLDGEASGADEELRVALEAARGAGS